MPLPSGEGFSLISQMLRHLTGLLVIPFARIALMRIGSENVPRLSMAPISTTSAPLNSSWSGRDSMSAESLGFMIFPVFGSVRRLASSGVARSPMYSTHASTETECIPRACSRRCSAALHVAPTFLGLRS